MADQVIMDSGDLRKYRTEIPNIIDDLGLNPYEGRLYLHYKRVCGASGGQCTEGTRRTAKHLGVGLGKLVEVRNSLADKGLIEKVEIGQYLHIRIVDIWELNFIYFSIKDRPSVAGWSIQQLQDYIKSVSPREHFNNNKVESVSPHEHFNKSVSPHEHLDPESVSPRERKKELKNKNQHEEKEGTDSLFSFSEIWTQAQPILSGVVTRATYEQVIQPCQPRPAANGTFTLAAPPELAEQVRRLEKPILRALNQINSVSELEVIDL